MPTVEKLSISLEPGLAEFARQRAAQAGQSLSTYLSTCIEAQRRRESLELLLLDLGAEDIPRATQDALGRELDELLQDALKRTDKDGGETP